MRSNPQLIERVLGQMEADDANTRGIAFETARRMLKTEGITFRDLHAAYVAQITEKAERDRRAASAPQPTPSARRASPPRRAPRENVLAKSDGTALYVHKPRVGMFTRRVDGLKVVRNRKPPTYAQGVLRILEDRIVGQGSFGPRHRMKLSFETDGTLYEPFFEEGERTDWVAQIHRLSADGDRIIY